MTNTETYRMCDNVYLRPACEALSFRVRTSDSPHGKDTWRFEVSKEPGEDLVSFWSVGGLGGSSCAHLTDREASLLGHWLRAQLSKAIFPTIHATGKMNLCQRWLVGGKLAFTILAKNLAGEYLFFFTIKREEDGFRFSTQYLDSTRPVPRTFSVHLTSLEVENLTTGLEHFYPLTVESTVDSPE